jgi:hypothetical protein
MLLKRPAQAGLFSFVPFFHLFLFLAGAGGFVHLSFRVKSAFVGRT